MIARRVWLDQWNNEYADILDNGDIFIYKFNHSNNWDHKATYYPNRNHLKPNIKINEEIFRAELKLPQNKLEAIYQLKKKVFNHED